MFGVIDLRWRRLRAVLAWCAACAVAGGGVAGSAWWHERGAAEAFGRAESRLAAARGRYTALTGERRGMAPLRPSLPRVAVARANRRSATRAMGRRRGHRRIRGPRREPSPRPAAERGARGAGRGVGHRHVGGLRDAARRRVAGVLPGPRTGRGEPLHRVGLPAGASPRDRYERVARVSHRRVVSGFDGRPSSSPGRSRAGVRRALQPGRARPTYRRRRRRREPPRSGRPG